MSSASVIKLFIAAAAYQKQSDAIGYTVDETHMSRMISDSNNESANALIDAVTMDYINSYIKKNDYNKTELNRKFAITKFEKDNYTSARDVGRLLEKIYTNQCEGAENILNYMKSQTHRNKIPAGVPSGITVANKTGELSSDYPNYPVENDAAIVYKQDATYLLVVLSTGAKDSNTAIEKVKQISERIYTKAGGLSEQAVGTGTASSATGTTSLLDNAVSKETREKIVKQAQTNDGLGAGAYQCEKWVEQVYRTVLGKGDDVITRHACAHEAGLSANNGTGPYTDSNNIVPGAAVFSYKSASGYRCGDHDAGHIGIYIGDGKIASWLGSSVGIRTIEEWKQTWNFDGWGWITGTESLGDGASGNDISSSEGDTFNYYFNTGVEGLMMFKSQYNWDKYAARNFFNIAGGATTAMIKIGLYFVFFVRMALLALITAFSPIIILIDTFKRLSGSQGYLKNWAKLYMFLMLIRPAIAFLYYIAVISNPYLGYKFPIYVAVVNIVIAIATFIAIKMLIADLRGRKKSNKVRSKA